MSDAEEAPGAPDFAYRAGALHAEAVPLATIAAAVGTPFYCYSSAAIERRYHRFAAAFADRRASLCYAVKANSNLAVIRLLARLGAGADVVSEGELRRALAAGVPAERIVFSGVGKTAAELAFALASGIRQINVESEPELTLLSEVASGMGRTAEIALRVNPDVDARTHAKIATGKKENKFGIDLAHAAGAFRRAAQLPGLSPVGIALHIGSQLTDLGPFELAYNRAVALLRALADEGIALRRLDLGGGLGIRYRNERPPAIEDYAALVKRVTAGLELELEFEPGRWLVGNAGVLVARVLYVKEGTSRRFLVQDAAMNDLLRPSLYEAWHEILPVSAPAAGAALTPVDVVGPVCETGDSFAAQRPLPPIAAGELLALMSAGAYGAAMSSSYNTRQLVPEVLVRGDRFDVIRPRPSYEALLSQDRMPDWLAER
ncbi:MAG TPA: diaminopimelate decarboxylase [Stellaceae bacterium]|nr:diaminopimelate decarboxylase [Stellaceae bacterium]